MNRLPARLAALLAWGLVAVGGAHASDFTCLPTPKSATARCDDPAASGPSCGRPDRRPAAQRMICEYAMLHMGYTRIDEDQQRLLRAGTLRQADVQAWRRRRDACNSVPCLDAVFAEWWRNRGARLTASRPTPLPAPAARPPMRELPAHEMALGVMAAPPAAMAAPPVAGIGEASVPAAMAMAMQTPTPAPLSTSLPIPIPISPGAPLPATSAPSAQPASIPIPEAAPQSSLLSMVHDTRPALPEAEVAAGFTTRHAMAWAWLLWLGLLLVASLLLDWGMKRRARPTSPQDPADPAAAHPAVGHPAVGHPAGAHPAAAHPAGADAPQPAAGMAGLLRAMPRVAIVLGTLLALNAILLLAVFLRG